MTQHPDGGEHAHLNVEAGLICRWRARAACRQIRRVVSVVPVRRFSVNVPSVPAPRRSGMAETIDRNEAALGADYGEGICAWCPNVRFVPPNCRVL
jgi:hypothetical protein